MTTFYSTTFSISHEVPAGGKIVVDFANGNPTGEFFEGSGGTDCLVSSHQNSDINCFT